MKRVASATGRISICSPSVSSCASSRSTLRRTSASCARERSSQKTAGAPVARARPTASRTQSATGASLVWHARHTSPGSTSCSSSGRAGRVDDADRARGLDLERLVVAAVLLGLLRHQADVRRRAHRRRVEGAVLAAEVDRLRVQGGVARVRDHRLGVLLLARRVPHLPRRADHRRHRGVDDHVARDVQVGDPAVGVDHRERRARRRRPARSPPRRPRARPRAAARSRSARSPARSPGWRRPRRARRRARAKTSAKYARTAWPKMIGSETFIIVAFMCTEKRTPRAFASATSRARNASSARRRITAASTISPSSTATPSLSTVTDAVGGDVLDAQLARGRRPSTDCSVERKSSVAHRRHVRPRVLRPGAHRVRVLAREGLHGGGRAAVGVALAQHGVDRAALDRVVDLARVLVLRHVVAGVLQLLDRRLQLRDRGRDVRQLDDVRVGRPRQLAELAERVRAPCRTRRGCGRRARCRAARPPPPPSRRRPRARAAASAWRGRAPRPCTCSGSSRRRAQTRPSFCTASRSPTSSSTVLSMRCWENSGTSRPCTISYSPSAVRHGNEEMIPSATP